MKRLIIAVDCDDVLVPSTAHIVRAYNLRYKTNVLIENSHSSDNSEWFTEPEEAVRRIHAIQQTREYAAIAPFDDAVKVCQQLAKHHELHLVTARPERLMPVTEQMLNQYLPGVFTSLLQLGIDGDKGEVCRKIGASVLVDDNQRHLTSAHSQAVEGLIWFGNYPWQIKDTPDTPKAIVRCLDWLAVEKEIEQIAKG